MLPLKNRLKKRKDFENIFEKGVTAPNRYFFLKIVQSDNPETRIGFIVSKKVSKKAVERNRVKRLFREAVQMNLIRIKPSYDLVFIVLNSAKNKTLLEIEKEVKYVLEKNQLII